MTKGFGFDASTLEQFITIPAAQKMPWGEYANVSVSPVFALQRLVAFPGKTLPVQLARGNKAELFVESGALQMESVTVPAGKLVVLTSGVTYEFLVTQATVAYVYSRTPEKFETSGRVKKTLALNVAEPTDVREKYWGDIRTIVSREIAGKRMFLKAKTHGSMEFHVKKYESYYVHSGELALLLRAGRAENRIFRVPAGTSVYLPPGLMHQRGAITDTVIFEISTADDDADSYLVEDGKNSPMFGFEELVNNSK